VDAYRAPTTERRRPATVPPAGTRRYRHRLQPGFAAGRRVSRTPATQPPGRAHSAPTVLAAAFWVGLGLGVAPWWYGTTGPVATTGATFIAVGRVTGLAAAYVLLVQILLTSRIGVLERWVGARLLLTWHRELAAVVVALVVGHVAFMVAGYTEIDHVWLRTEVWSVLTTYQDMVSATVAAGVLLAVAVLAGRRVRALLSYERWYRLHLAAYLVLLLGYGHQFADGRELERAGPVRYGWIALYAVVVGCLAWGRLVRPLWTNMKHRLRVADVVEEGPETVSVYVVGRRLADLHARAGQFFRWRFLTRGMWWQSHPFSLSAAPNGKWLRLTVKAVGDHTDDLYQMLRPGVRVLVGGPSGDFTADRRIRFRALLIAGGTGIAPVRALLEELPPHAVVIYRATRWEDIVFKAELDYLAWSRQASVVYAIGHRDDPRTGAVLTPEGIRALVPDVRRRDVYLCGPTGLVESAVGVLRRLRVPRRQVHLDPFEF
jgi:predicted ferric reductase